MTRDESTIAFLDRLAHRHALPVQAIATIALATVVGAAGRSFSLQVPAPASQSIHPVLNFILAGATDDITQRLLSALNEIVEPLRNLQAELIERRDTQPPEIAAESPRLSHELHRLESSPYPDPRHIAHVQGLLRQHRRTTKVQLVVTNLRSGLLPAAVAQSPDNALLNLITDDVKFNQRLNQSHTRPNQVDWDILRASWLQQDYCAPGLTLTPSLSTIIVCRPETFQRFIAHGGLKESGVTEVFQPVLINEAERTRPAVSMDIDEVASRRAWAGLLRKLVEQRGDAESPGIIEPSGPVERIVEEYKQAFGVDGRTERLLWRLAGAFLLVAGSWDTLVAEKSIVGAIRLQRWHLAHGHRTPRSEASAARPVVTQAECDRMFAKIRVRAPIRPHDLFRCYHRQEVTVHRPVLDELLSARFSPA